MVIIVSLNKNLLRIFWGYWLKRHLDSVYGINAKIDKIKLFFHFPIAATQATLHLHRKVNVGDHPHNMASSFSLDDIIDCLEQEVPISHLITRRFNGVIYTTRASSFEGIVEAKEIDNPFKPHCLSEQFLENHYF